MAFLNAMLFSISKICVMIWYYCSELGKRWKLRESAFRSAGDRAGRRGCADDLVQARFLLQAKHVLEMIGSHWNSKKLLLVRHWESVQERFRQEFAQDEAHDLKEIEKRCKRRLGYVPRFNPLETEFFWAILLGGGIIEFFLNSSALETGGQSENLTRILATILSLAFVLGVHLLGKHKAQGKPILLPTLLLAGLIVGVTLIREGAVVGYMKRVQESVPELSGGNADPRVYVLLFLGVQVLFFYIAYHWSVQHYDPLLYEHHQAKMAERRKRSYNSTLQSLDRRLDNIAITSLNEWADYQRFFDHRMLILAEAAELHLNDGHVVLPRIQLAEPPVVTWGRLRLSGSPHPLLPASAYREEQAQ
jgi:hypothetical protein